MNVSVGAGLGPLRASIPLRIGGLFGVIGPLLLLGLLSSVFILGVPVVAVILASFLLDDWRTDEQVSHAMQAGRWSRRRAIWSGLWRSGVLGLITLGLAVFYPVGLFAMSGDLNGGLDEYDLKLWTVSFVITGLAGGLLSIMHLTNPTSQRKRLAERL